MFAFGGFNQDELEAEGRRGCWLADFYLSLISFSILWIFRIHHLQIFSKYLKCQICINNHWIYFHNTYLVSTSITSREYEIFRSRHIKIKLIFVFLVPEILKLEFSAMLHKMNWCEHHIDFLIQWKRRILRTPNVSCPDQPKSNSPNKFLGSRS